jgi:hypothetical protein
MRVYAYAAVTIAAGVCGVASLTVDASGSAWEQTASVTLDGSAGVIAFARDGIAQEAGVEVVVGGTTLNLDDLVGGGEVRRSRREHVQSAHFAVKLSEWGVSPLGDPFAALGSPTGTEEIEVWGCYRDDVTGQVHRLPLLLRGTADTVSRDSGPSGHVESYEVLDQFARWARVPVSMTLPPGHGLTTGRITRKLLEAAGETEFALEDGRQRHKELQLIDGDAVATAQERNDVEGRILRSDRFGRAVNPTLKPNSYAAPVVVTEVDFLELAVVRVVFPPDVITKVIASGTAQVHAEADAVCGDVVGPDIRNEVYKYFAPFNAAGLQGGGCTITPLFPSEEPRQQLYSLTITRQTTRCDKVRHEESESWAWFDPEAARRVWSGGARTCVSGVYLPAGATDDDDDGSPAYAVPRAFWALIGRTVTDRYYDAPGWQGPPIVDAAGNNDFHLQGSPLGSETGRYLGSISRGQSYYNPRAAKKVQSGTPVPFEELDVTDVFELGNGETVRDSVQTFMETAVEIELVRSSTESGFIEAENLITKAWAIVPNGTRCQFSDGSLSEHSVEQFTVARDETTSYAPTGQNVHVQTRVVSKISGEQEPTTVDTVAQAPPTVEYLPGYEPYDEQAFLDEEDATSLVEAKRGDTRPIEVEVSADGLLPMHFPREVKANYPHAEDEDELATAGLSMIRESCIIKATGTMGANFVVVEGAPLLVTHRPSGIGVAREAVLDAVAWQCGPGQPATATWSIDFYPPEEAIA